MSKAYFYLLTSCGLSVNRAKRILDTTPNTTKHNNDLRFWIDCDLSKTTTRAEAIRTEAIRTNKVATNSNKVATTEHNEKNALVKALDDSKKSNSARTEKFTTNKKIIRFSLFGTGLFHNTLFNTKVLENTIIDNINRELNNDSMRLQYIEFWEACNLKHTYKRSTISTTLAKQDKAKKIKRDTLVIERTYDTFAELAYDKEYFNECSNQIEECVNYSTNDFINHMLNQHLPERIVWSDLMSLFNRTGNKIFWDILHNANTIINKDDITQELKAFMIEKAFIGEYTVDKNNKLVFDMVECFRHINNYLYHHNNRDTFKKIHLDQYYDSIMDFGYIDNELDSIDSDLLVRFSDYCYSLGASTKTIHTMQDIIGGLLGGYKYRVIAESLHISENVIKQYMKRYIKPFLLIENHWLEKRIAK